MFKGLKHNYIALGVCAIACCAWSYVLDLRYYRLGYLSWDLPLYANLMWNLCHGHVQTSLFGGNFFIDHFNAFAFLLVPFYYFFQTGLTVLYFKLFAFFTGAYVFYLLAAKRLNSRWAIALMLAYIFYPTNVGMIFFEFNFENLGLPMIFLLFYFFEEKRFLGFMLTCFLLTTVKENMPLVVLMFGIYGFWARKDDRWRWGLCPFLLGVGMFLGEVFIFIPWFRQGLGSSNVHWSLYLKLGHNPAEIVRTLIFQEPKVFKMLFNPHNVTFLLKLFGPLLIAAFMAPRYLLLAGPFFLQDLLSKYSGQQDIESFYSSTLTVYIFMAAIDFLGRFKNKFKTYILGGMVLLLAMYNLWYLPRWCEKMIPIEEKQAVAQYFLAQIPPDAQVLASYKFLYLLSQRKDLYVLYLKNKTFAYQKQVVPSTVNYMAVDFSSRVDNKDSIRNILAQGPWKLQGAADEFVFLKKKPFGETLFKSGEHAPTIYALHPVMAAGEALNLEGLEMPTSLRFGQRFMKVVFYWKALENDKNEKSPLIALNILQGFRRFYLKESAPFYALPVVKGKYYRETFYYFIPQLSPGNYMVVIYPIPTKKAVHRPNTISNLYIKDIPVVLN